MSQNDKEAADKKPRARLGKCFVSGWGMSKDGKVTIVERHELPLKGPREIEEQEELGDERIEG